MPKNPNSPFSGRSWELPVCLHASARSSCRGALPKICTLCLKSSHIQNKMKFSPSLSQQGRETAYATLPFPAEQREPFVLSCSPMASEWEKIKKKLPFLSWEAGLQQHLGICCLQEREWSSTWGMLPRENFPTRSFSSLSLNSSV